MSETTNIPPIVLGAATLCSCGALCGAVVGVRIGALHDAAWFLILLAALFGLVGFIAGAIWGLSGHAPQLSAPPALVAIVTGVVKGGVALGGLGLLLGSCMAAFAYQNLSNSYVRAREAPDMAIIMLILVTLPAFITGIVGGGIWAVLRRIIR